MSQGVARRASVLVALALAATRSPARSRPRTGKIAPATKVFSFLEAFLKVPAGRDGPRDQVDLRPDARGQQAATGVKATLVEASRTRALRCRSTARTVRAHADPGPTSGRRRRSASTMFPPTPSWARRCCWIPALKPAAEYDARELVATVEESQQGHPKAAGRVAPDGPSRWTD